MKSTPISSSSSTFFNMVNDGFITYNLIYYALGPCMLRDTFNVEPDMILHVRSVAKIIQISGTEPQLNSPINCSPNDKDNISGVPLRKNGDERTRVATMHEKFMLTNTKLMENEVFHFFTRSHTERPLILDHHSMMGQQILPVFHLFGHVRHLEGHPWPKPGILGEVDNTSLNPHLWFSVSTGSTIGVKSAGIHLE
jgi:hypothetical protein